MSIVRGLGHIGLRYPHTADERRLDQFVSLITDFYLCFGMAAETRSNDRDLLDGAVVGGLRIYLRVHDRVLISYVPVALSVEDLRQSNSLSGTHYSFSVNPGDFDQLRARYVPKRIVDGWHPGRKSFFVTGPFGERIEIETQSYFDTREE